jgi:hypothetical protein
MNTDKETEKMTQRRPDKDRRGKRRAQRNAEEERSFGRREVSGRAKDDTGFSQGDKIEREPLTTDW